MLVGGGSGGHITPLLAVAHKLKQTNSEIEISYVIEKGGRFSSLPKKSADVDEVFSIRAGKFRRYHNRSKIQHLLDFSTNIKNLRDFFYFVIGFFQSLRVLIKAKPQSVFIKGGFVGVPLGFACKILHVPYFTHDSDTVPGLANRLISKNAQWHAVGMPPEFYKYPIAKIRYVGIPLNANIVPVSNALKMKYRSKLGLPADSIVICVTGGSLGAQRLNKAFVSIAKQLLEEFPRLYVLHITGETKENIYNNFNHQLLSRIIVKEFVDDFYLYTGSSDLVITRAGATTVAELAVQGKATILVPNPELTDGQQTKNAHYLKASGAVMVVEEKDMTQPDVFVGEVRVVLSSPASREQLKENISKLAKPHATDQLANMCIELAEKSDRKR